VVSVGVVVISGLGGTVVLLMKVVVVLGNGLVPTDVSSGVGELVLVGIVAVLVKSVLDVVVWSGTASVGDDVDVVPVEVIGNGVSVIKITCVIVFEVSRCIVNSTVLVGSVDVSVDIPLVETLSLCVSVTSAPAVDEASTVLVVAVVVGG